MKISRNLSGKVLINKLNILGYKTTRQTGSHIRLTTIQKGEHHITIPNHDSLRIGTISSILSDIAQHFGKTKAELISELFQ